MDAFCLQALIREAQPVLRGAKIIRAVQPDRWSLLLFFQRGRGPGGFRLSVRPGDPAVALLPRPREIPHSPSRFADVVTSQTKGALVEGIEQLGLERIVALRLKGGAVPDAAMTLYAEMLGPRGTLVLVDRPSGTVIGRLRSPSRPGSASISGPDQAYRPPPDRGRVDPRGVREGEFHQLVRPRVEAGIEAARVLLTCFTGFSQVMAAELVARAGLSLPAAPDEQARSLWKPFRELIDRVSEGLFEPRLLIGDDAAFRSEGVV